MERYVCSYLPYSVREQQVLLAQDGPSRAHLTEYRVESVRPGQSPTTPRPLHLNSVQLNDRAVLLTLCHSGFYHSPECRLLEQVNRN